MIDLNAKQVSACPLNGHACIDGVRDDFPDRADQPGVKIKCRWWQHIYGKDPQSEKIIDQFDCSVPWLTITTVETSQMSRQTSASVDKVANEIATLKTDIHGLGGAIRIAAGEIRQGIETGSLRVMLPGPDGTEPKTNGHDTRDLKEGDKKP
jgi:hypothetical protein